MAYPTSGSTTTYVGTENIGDVVTKANLDTTPGGLVAYAQITANASAQTAGFSYRRWVCVLLAQGPERKRVRE